MTLIQAILLGGCYWMYVNEIGSGFNYAVFCYPSTACLWYGLILGDMHTALVCGGTIAPLFLGYAAVGAIVSTDKAAACLIPTAAVICYGMDLNVAMALSVPVGILFSQMHILKRTIGSWYIRRAENIIEKDCTNGKQLFMNGILLPSLVKVVLFWLPMTLICYFALQTFSEIMDQIPTWLQAGLSTVGSVLPALGMGLLLNGMGEKKMFPFFLAGYFIALFTGLNSIAMILIALFMAWLYVNTSADSSQESVDDDDDEEFDKVETVLTKKDIIGAYLRWMAFNEVPSSYERHMGYGFLMSFYPCMRKLYKGRPEELKDACQRHLSYFNTEQFWGACVPGAALAMEEQKALGAPISGEMIESVKVGLMGPFAGIGDTINWVALCPIYLGIFIPYCVQGHVWAAIIPMLIEVAMVNTEGLLLFPFGYKLGVRAASTILASGKLKTFFKFLGVLGMFMVGSLSSSLVNVSTPLQYTTSGNVQTIQSLIDSFVPGILSLLVILFVYWFLEKFGRKAVNRCMLILLVGAIVLGSLGILM